MRPAGPSLVAFFIGLAAAVASADAKEVPRLHFDPFARPDFEHGEPSSGISPGAWTPMLRGTLVAGGNSLANLGGRVLRIGEEANGYRLVAVRRWEAVFDRNGSQIVLRVGPGTEEHTP